MSVWLCRGTKGRTRVGCTSGEVTRCCVHQGWSSHACQENESKGG